MSAPRAFGSGMSLAPELLLRQVLMEGLVELAGSPSRLAELFGRTDDMRHGSQEQWTRDMQDAAQGLVAIEGGVPVLIGYPAGNARLPVVSIVLESGREDTSGATVGDIAGTALETIGDPSAPTRYDLQQRLAVPWDTALQLGCWATGPEESVLLGAVVKSIVFRDKGRLMEAGVLDVGLSETGMQPDPQLYPRIGYVPIIRASLSWTWRQTRKTTGAPVTYTLLPATFGN